MWKDFWNTRVSTVSINSPNLIISLAFLYFISSLGAIMISFSCDRCIIVILLDLIYDTSHTCSSALFPFFDTSRGTYMILSHGQGLALQSCEL
jgi:hypothetical protein